jgi:hypothetical protein
MKNATTKYNLTADNGLGVIGKVRWVLNNVLNNYDGDVLNDTRLTFSRYNSNQISRWDEVSPFVSPARRLCDFFWKDLNWNELINKLGGDIRAVEIGCGSGIYGDLIYRQIADKLTRYIGIDIYEDKGWSEYKDIPQFQFKLGNASSLDDDLRQINFLFTQSALEHFEDDYLFFKQVASFVNQLKTPFVQVHLMPSEQCLTTFPWHGFRQYTLSSISSITRLFNDNTTCELISLGGSHCNSVHKKYITIPQLLTKKDFRRTKTTEYNEALKNAILADERSSPNQGSAFYALILETNF